MWTTVALRLYKPEVNSFGQAVFFDRLAGSVFPFHSLWHPCPPPQTPRPPAPRASTPAAVLSEPWVRDLLPPKVTGLCFNESQNNVSAGCRGEPERQLYLWLTRWGNNAANMHLSLPSYCDTSFSASSLLNLRLRDLDFLSGESIFPLLSHIFFSCWQRRQKKTRRWWGGGEWSGIVLSSGPGLAVPALILLSPTSKQRRNEKTVCKLISSTTHYQTHARTNPQLPLWLLPTWRN